jgi:hypothetical protein
MSPYEQVVISIFLSFYFNLRARVEADEHVPSAF